MEFKEVIKNRYSCKKYDGRQVEKEQLDAIPENEEILMLLDLGYAAEGAGPLANHELRKALDETVTYM